MILTRGGKRQFVYGRPISSPLTDLPRIGGRTVDQSLRLGQVFHSELALFQSLLIVVEHALMGPVTLGKSGSNHIIDEVSKKRLQRPGAQSGSPQNEGAVLFQQGIVLHFVAVHSRIATVEFHLNSFG